MAIGTTLAGILIGSGISAGVSAYGASRAAGAAKDAAKTQAESADKAIALQRDIFETRRQDLAPYTSAGGAAMNTLAEAMGLPAGPAPAPMAGGAPPVSTARQRPPEAPALGLAGPRNAPMTPMAPPAGSKASAQTASSMAPAVGGAVRMQTPTGQIVLVPAERVNEAVLRGGQVVQ
jgi:hypothetical protein